MTSLSGVLARGILRRALPQAVALLVVGAVVGLVLNKARLDPLPFNLPEALLLTESGAEAVFLGQARQLFDDADYVFVDVRSEDAFVEQHITDAFNLPLEEFVPLYPELRIWTAGQPLLVYGSAREIVVVDDAARRLLEAGEDEVVILADGIEGWAARGYPLASGSDGLLENVFEEEVDDAEGGFEDEDGDPVDQEDPGEVEGQP